MSEYDLSSISITEASPSGEVITTIEIKGLTLSECYSMLLKIKKIRCDYGKK